MASRLSIGFHRVCQFAIAGAVFVGGWIGGEPAGGRSVSAQTVTLDGPAREADPNSPATRGSAEVRNWLQGLDDDSFHRRRAVAEKLWGEVDPLVPETPSRKEVVAALWQGTRHDNLEVRLLCHRLLARIESVQFDHQIGRLLNHRVPANEIRLDGWNRFRRHAGDDMLARSLFARVATRYHNRLTSLDIDGERAGQAETLDPYHVATDDTVAWALMLMCDEHQATSAAPSSRITTALGYSGLGPRPEDRYDGEVLRRMIGHWVATHSCHSLRQRLLIAMRYQCVTQVNLLCDQVFADPHAPPSAQVAAMLSASKLGRADLPEFLRRRLSDRRTAHVWQLVASHQTRIRTQVRDVALALWLHRRDIDPRECGFVELQADPVWVFRDHSLGFADESARVAAYGKAMIRIPEMKRFLDSPSTDSIANPLPSTDTAGH